MIYLGSHVGLSAPNYFEDSVKTALSCGENTFMFYTGAPQNTKRIPLEKLKIEEGKRLIAEAGLDLAKIVAHAPYIINPATKKEATREIALKMLSLELERVEEFGVSWMVLHPGSAVDISLEEALRNAAETIDLGIEGAPKSHVTICIETMAGKGREIGKTFEEIAMIISLSKYPERLGVCLDTCHINDAGYDVFDVDGVLDQFDRVIGLSKLKVVHLNDSKNPRGSHKDRHENVGEGKIGFETLEKWLKNPRLEGIPFELETPWVNQKTPNKAEVEMLRKGVYVPDWKKEILAKSD